MSNLSNLRPYYDHESFNPGYAVIYKPGIGLIDTTTNRPLSTSIISQASFKKGSNFQPGKGLGINALEGDKLGKNYAYDLEFHEYFDFNNLTELFKNLLINFTRNYCKILSSQPLEIVRLLLQVGVFDFNKKKPIKPKKSHKRLIELEIITEEVDSSSSDYEIDYFQNSADTNEWAGAASSPKKKLGDSGSLTKKIDPVSAHSMDVLGSIIGIDGPLGLFRGVNAAFIYQTLSHTIEAWITGFVSPFLGIPDPFFLDLTHSNDPLKSLWLSVGACVLTGVVLMPLDLIKVKMMITKMTPVDSTVTFTRSVRESIRNYPLPLLVSPPPSIFSLTTLHQFSSSIFRKMIPYVLFIRFNIDSYNAPNIYTFVNLISLIMELFIKLPIENLLRKEQVKYLLSPKDIDHGRVVSVNHDELIVEVDEREVEMTLVESVKKLGLFNGWRVGVLNVIAFWGYNIIKSNGMEMKEEKL